MTTPAAAPLVAGQPGVVRFYPLLDGQPYDPAGAGGAVARLRLFADSTRTGVPVVDVGPAVRIAFGEYEFTVPAIAAAALYYDRVDWTAAATGPAVVVDGTTNVLAFGGETGTPDGQTPLWLDVAELATEFPALTAEQRQAAAQTATDVLHALSGRQYHGRRTERLLVAPAVSGPSIPLGLGSPFAAFLPVRTTGCGCHARDLDPMLPGPIVRVVRLVVANVDVPLGQVVVHDRRTVRVRPPGGSIPDPLAVNFVTDGEGFYSLFPSGAVSCGRRATVDLTVEWGAEPPAGGRLGALALAREIAKGIGGDDSCRLPGNVVSVNRQGVTVLLDPATFLSAGRTGIPEADEWLASVNPSVSKDGRGKRAASTVWWPEAPIVERLS